MKENRKKRIRCCFVDFWPSFDYKINLGFLLSEYEIIIDKNNPDYLFYSCFGMTHLLYDHCIKIFWSGENAMPDLNICDYALSLSNVKCDDRTFRLCSEGMYRTNGILQISLTEEMLLKRRFCNFIYGNNICADPYRIDFYKKLSEYKRIDSAGSLMNNMDNFKVPESERKISFISKYKFTIAIENSSQKGYSTEKIVDPFIGRSLPIYWGNPNISSDYNPNSFVNLMDYASMDEAIEEIIRLDKDDDAYLEKMTTPFWPYGNSFQEFYNCEIERIMVFFRNIFEQPLEKAYRRTKYGWVKNYSSDLKKYYFYPEIVLKERIVKPVKDKVKKIIRK